MLSIFIMYSDDRKSALDFTLRCLREMPLYSECQKTLVVDGRISVIPDEWEVVQVPRLNDKFCWARMWDAGVLTARHEQVIYLDSDRMFGSDFLSLMHDKIVDDVFVFTSKHFHLLKIIDFTVCQRLLSEMMDIGALGAYDLVGTVRYEPRHKQVVHGPGKNVMSGGTGFTKSTYWKLGGVDRWYCGHGAYADTDFHMTAAQQGCKFVDLGVPELHFPHAKRAGSIDLDDVTLQRLALDNFIYYCHKWKLPLSMAENVAFRSGIAKPMKYINEKLKEL